MNKQKPNDEEGQVLTKLSEKVRAMLEKAVNGRMEFEDYLWIRSATSLQELYARSHPKPVDRINYKAIVTALACLVIVSLLLTVKVGDIPNIGSLSRNNISLDVNASALSFHLNNDQQDKVTVNDDQLRCARFESHYISEFHLSNADVFLNDTSGALGFSITGNDIFLNQLEINGAANLALFQNDSLTDLEIIGSSVSGVLTFDSARLSIPPNIDTTIVNREFPEFAYFRYDSQSTNPLRAKIQATQKLELLNARLISALRFTTEYVEGLDQVAYRSSILSGSVKMHDIEKEIMIGNSERIVFDEIEGRISELSVAPGRINLKFVGQARHIRTGPTNGERSQAPTWLEYFYKNQPLAVVWGALVFLWGFLSSVRANLFLKT